MILAQILTAISVRDLRAPESTQASWSHVAVHQSGTVARSYDCGGEVYFQVGAVQQVNVTSTLLQQDENALAATPEGFLVAYDDRGALIPGGYMTCRARRFTVAGQPLGPDFLVNASPQLGSAWRPLLAVRADGLVAFLFTSGWDNDGTLRLMDANGAFTTSDVPVGTNPNGDQEDPAGAWLPNGDLFTVFVDFHGGALGLELMHRTYRPGTGWLASPARLVPSGLPLDQREPRVAVASDGVPWITYQDSAGVWLLQGSGGIPAQHLGTGRLAEPVPPFILYESGSDVVAWPYAQPLARYTNGAQSRPSGVLNGATLWVAWHGQSWVDSSSDVFVRAFQVQP